MKRNSHPSQPVPPVMRLFTILLCFAAGGFCLFKSGIGQSVEQPVVAASVPVKTAQAPSSSSEYKLKSVADFKVGDTIMALNHETGQREQKIVKQTFQRQVDHLRILEVQGEDGSRQTIKTTDEHPFWVPAADEYVEAKHLTPGTKLTGANGHFITVKSTRYEPHPEGVTVYNVEVEDFHNYFVAANGYRGPPVLAHNTCKNFYTVQSSEDAARLAKGGGPWPSAANRAALGEGVYAWGSKADAESYLNLLKKRGIEDVSIVKFSIKDEILSKLKRLDVDSLDDPSDWLSKHSRLWDGTPDHGLQYISRGTNFGLEHFFDKSIIQLLEF